MTLRKETPFIPQTLDQIIIQQSGLLQTPMPLLLNLTTGAGKTRMSEVSINHVLRAHRVVYLSPTKGLGYSQHRRWQDLFVEAVGIFNSDYPTPPIPFKEARLMVMTPERFDLCLRRPRYNRWLSEVRLLILDELHLLGEGLRGARLEGAIARFHLINPLAYTLSLSATVSNACEIADWLGATLYQSAHRQIPLLWQEKRYSTPDQKQHQLLSLLQQTARWQTLIFCQSRRQVDTLASYLTGQGIQAGAHHAGKSAKQRKSVEDAFNGGNLPVLVATNTLAQGVNTPADQVILYDLERFDGGSYVPLSIREVQQMVGRCGRSGQEAGYVTLMLHYRSSLGIEHYKQDSEPVLSQLSQVNAVVEQVIVAVGSGLCRTIPQIKRLLGCTLAAHQHRLSPFEEIMSAAGQSGIRDLDAKSLLTPQVISLTPSAQVATNYLVQPKTVEHFQQLLQKPLTFFDLLIATISCPDGQTLSPPRQESVIKVLETYLKAQPSILLRLKLSGLCTALNSHSAQLLCVLYTSAIVKASTQPEKEQLWERLGFAADITSLLQSVQLLLKTLLNLSNTSRSDAFLCEKIQVLMQMLETGLNESAVTLTLLKGIGGKKAKRLQDAGVWHLGSVAELTADQLSAIPITAKGTHLSKEVAARCIQQAQSQIKAIAPHRFVEVMPQQVNTRSKEAAISSHEYAQQLKQRLQIASRLQLIPLSTTDGIKQFQVLGEPVIQQVSMTSKQQWTCSCTTPQTLSCQHILSCQKHLKTAQYAMLSSPFSSSFPLSFSLFDL